MDTRALVAALALGCSAELEPPRISLTCSFAEHSVFEVPDSSPGAGACFELMTDLDWRIAPASDEPTCPATTARCASGLPGELFMLYRTQTKVVQTGGLQGMWVNCENACTGPLP